MARAGNFIFVVDVGVFGRDLNERISFGEKKGFLIWERFYASEYNTEDVP